MASPEVWQEARSRLEAANLGVPIAWPNEGFADPADSTDPIFVSVEIEGGLSAPIEIGLNATWEESGALWCHVMIPSGTGIVAGIALRKTIANLFRDLPPGPVTWTSADLDIGGQSEDGGYFSLPLRVTYRFHDRPL